MARDDFYQEDNFQEDYPSSWKPNTGDFVGGVIQRYDRASTEFRGERREHPICVLEVEHISGGADVRRGDEVGIWLLHTVLLSKFEELRPRPGERIGIRKTPSPPDKQYHNYVVKVDRDPEDEQVPDFSRYQKTASDRGAVDGGGRGQDATAAYRPDPQRTADPEGRHPPDREQKRVPGAGGQGGGPGEPRGDRPPPQDDDLPF